jgi:ligand-binding SRPBCC domain-containing protein
MSAFDRSLFEYLKPKGAKMEIVAFTGSETGDKVHIRFTFPVKVDWISDIVDHGVNEDEAYFLDEGTTLPWPLKKWRHRHVVKNKGENQSVIEDQIEYKTSNVILDALIRPVMYMAFYPRRAQYQKYFK